MNKKYEDIRAKHNFRVTKSLLNVLYVAYFFVGVCLVLFLRVDGGRYNVKLRHEKKFLPSLVARQTVWHLTAVDLEVTEEVGNFAC